MVPSRRTSAASPRRSSPLVRTGLVLTLASLAVGACSDTGTDTGAGVDGAPQVITTIYPLTFVTERVMGDGADLTSLTQPGADPHDLELSPQQVGSLGGADLVLYNSGMVAAVDDAVTQQAGDHSLDASPVADLLSGAQEEADGASSGGEGEDSEAEGSLDPHFWLDPLRLADVGDATAERLAEIDPDNAQQYTDNAAQLRGDLEDLDAEYESGLADCDSRTIVVSHEAFGYLAERYDLEQIGITGLTAEAEPSPARIAQVSRQVQDAGVQTVYAEVLLGADLADTIARETGADVLVLDPVEGITPESAGSDYLEVMRSNLETLRQGQGCS